MKISDCIISTPEYGIAEIKADELCKCFGKSKIISTGDPILPQEPYEYRFVNSRLGIKIDISKDDAETIIDKLNLQFWTPTSSTGRTKVFETGGEPLSKSFMADFRHRAMRHLDNVTHCRFDDCT